MEPRANYRTVIEAIAYLKTLDREGKGDEPVFILRGQDQLSVAVVFYWAQLAEQHHVDFKKVTGAWKRAEEMAAWVPRRLPD
jgi:hypothetical protein